MYRVAGRFLCLVFVAAVWVTGAQSVEAAGVEILSPAAGSEVSGEVEVVARVVPPRSVRLHRVVMQTADGEAVRMAPRFADTYSAVLDTAQLRNGRQAVVVIASAVGGNESTLHPDTAGAWESEVRAWQAEVPVVVHNEYQHYWGDLHAHTSYSDGCRLPAEAYAYARDRARLDFFAVTDHSELLTLEEYADTIAVAGDSNLPGRFVALYGVECTDATGHMNVYMSATPYLPAALDDRYSAIGERALLGHFNHPGLTSPADQGWSDDFEGFHYAAAADGSMALVEVRNPEEEAAYIALLEAGWHVGAAGCQDQHEATWGTGGSTWTVALARELTRESILEALRARRTYSAGDRNLRLTFTMDGEDMGARITRPAGTLSCLVTVSDPDTSDRIDRIELFVDGRVVQTVRPALTRYAWAVTLELSPGEHYCFVRVAQAGEKTSWSSPIWMSAY